jgi:hypothetical protein
MEEPEDGPQVRTVNELAFEQPAEANVPDEAFMVAIMDPAAMADVSGVARYRDEFDEAM